MSQRINSIPYLLIIFIMFFSGSAYASITIVNNGKSSFSIVIPEKSPVSIHNAADELQKNIKLSTGVKLPIETDNNISNKHYISLGSTRQASDNKVTIKNLKEEGFRIRTKDGNLFIIGPDTAARIGPEKSSWGWRVDNKEFQLQPNVSGPQLTKQDGFSNGTANGVYTFLEDYLGVHWLMPGDIGRVVPKKDTFSIPIISRIEKPFFLIRDLPYLYITRQKTTAIQTWAFRQKLGFSVRVRRTHWWNHAVPARLYKKHPDWFAMDKQGNRKPKGRMYKLETTNQGMIKYYAKRAVSYVKRHPHLGTYSLSPTDGRGYSQSPASKKLYEPNPNGGIHPSVTRAILKFYRQVGKIVAKKAPNIRLGAFIYQDFRYPPKKGSMRIPNNVYPMLVSRIFSYNFFNKKRLEENNYLLHEWTTKSHNNNWSYYGFPINLRNSAGMILPPAPKLLNSLFYKLKKYNFMGVYLYGGPTWSQEAIGNYILAKLLWDPSLNAKKIAHQWLKLAYGEEAGKVIGNLYENMVDGAFAKFMANTPHGFGATKSLFTKYYAKNYKKIESAVLQAKSKNMTNKQKLRLQLLIDNVIVLQWRLKNAGYLSASYNSSLTHSNRYVAHLLKSWQDDAFQLFPGTIYPAGQNKVHNYITPVKIKITEDTNKTNVKGDDNSSIPNSDRILLYSTYDGYMWMNFNNVDPGSSFLSYRIADAESGRDVQSGIIYNRLKVRLIVKKNHGYYFYTNALGVQNPKVKWDMKIPNSTLANVSFNKNDNILYLSSSEGSPIYVYMPKNYRTSPGVIQKTKEDSSGITIYTPKTAKEKISEKYLFKQIIEKMNKGWKFHPDPDKNGKKKGFNKVNYDDNSWKSITATKQWQFQGFPEFHGTGWYRKTFKAKAITPDYDPGHDIRMLLYFGGVDGNAVIYLNGDKVGEHKLGYKYKGWNEPFVVDITDDMKNGKNLVAVKVTKNNPKLAGGIFKGVELRLAELK